MPGTGFCAGDALIFAGGDIMTDRYESFISHSANLLKEFQAEKIGVTEDLNKASNWFLGISTAALGVLIIKLDAISIESWMGSDQKHVAFIVIGGFLITSVLLGAIHLYFSIRERVCYRMQIYLHGLQGLSLFVDGFCANKNVDTDLYGELKNGKFLTERNIEILLDQQKKGKNFGRVNFRLVMCQQALTACGYVS